jgi:hypothetical protein
MMFNRYNSVVFTTFSARDYNVALVTPEFITGGSWNKSAYPGHQSAVLQHLQDSVGQLEKLPTFGDCISTYTGSDNAANWGNLLIVTFLASEDTVLAMRSMGSTSSPVWADNFMCGEFRNLTVQQSTVNCAISHTEQCNLLGDDTEACTGFAGAAQVDYCLAQTLPPKCTVRLSTTVLAIVTICNLLKAIVMLLTAMCGFTPLANIGDAIASFLDEPDPAMEGQGPLAVFDVRNGEWKNRAAKLQTHPEFERRIHYWSHAVSMGLVSRWILFASL